MTRIESIKYIIWGADTPDFNDSEISNLISSFGYNGCIHYLATSQLIQISNTPTSINDGANSFSFNNRISGLEKIIKMADRKEFLDPESSESGGGGKYFTLDTHPNKCKDYWGR